MSGSLRPARLITAIAAGLLIAYAVIWTQVSSFDVGRSDFTAFYVGGTLLREGHTGDLYSQAVQQPLHDALIAPDREGNLPFVNTPVAAALVLPATFLPLDVAYRAWSVLELAILVLAIVVAIRSVEWPAGTARIWQVAAGAVALAGVGTWTMAVQAQWTPVLALGLVLAYRSWKGGHLATGAAVLIMSAGIAKPHLALGLLAFLLGWRERRLIIGAIAGAAGLALASIALVGPGGVAGFIGILASSTTRWDLATMVSFIGVVGSLFGNGVAAHVIGLLASLLACAAAVWLGTAVRRDPSRLDTALVGAAVLSLVASPHAYPDDLVMLAPALVIGVAAAARRAASSATMTFKSPVAIVLGAWVLIAAAACVDLVDAATFPPGQLAGWALAVAAALACVATGQNRQLAGVPSLRVAGLGGAGTRS
ncbi:MAG: glycosyltransferase 87 family protein [Candidatus Dormibacteria bacterium]